MLRRLLNFTTNRIYSLPIIILMPHSRCNCRCVMCDIWKANSIKKELGVEHLQKHIQSFVSLGVREIVFSGGEPLMHSNLWKLCDLLKAEQIKLTLLSTGLLIDKNAEEIIRCFDNVIISLDGHQALHDKIRNIPGGYEKIRHGISALRKLNPEFRVTARCVLQRYNFFDFIQTVRSSRTIGVDQISFLAADISTAAFNHAGGMSAERITEIALTGEEVQEFRKIIESSFTELKNDYDSKFIAESPKKMLRIVQYYKALNGHADFPQPVCNAPWVSAVVESNGDVMPCFFHKPYGNIFESDFLALINSENAIAFRKNLKMETDSNCKKCVCSLKLPVI